MQMKGSSKGGQVLDTKNFAFGKSPKGLVFVAATRNASCTAAYSPKKRNNLYQPIRF
jgi:hypothetical protein